MKTDIIRQENGPENGPADRPEKRWENRPADEPEETEPGSSDPRSPDLGGPDPDAGFRRRRLRMEEALNRIRYRAARIFTIFFLTAAGAAAGCGSRENAESAAARTQQEETAAQEETRQEKTQQTEAQQAENRQEETGQTETAAAQTMDPQAFEIISRDFSHSGYVDSIAFLLPSGWAYESYERMHAGEGMDPEEWGFEIRMDGKEEPVLLVYGSRQEGEGRFDPENESSQEVQTGAGLTGQRYTRQTVAEDGGIRQEYYVRFDSVAGSGAVYQVYASLSPEDYEKYRTSLDTLTAGISIAAIARTE